MLWVYLVGAFAIGATFVSDIWISIDYRVAANVSLIYMAALVSAFTVIYGLRSSWRANRIGKVFLAHSIAFSIVLWQIVVAVWIDTDYPFRQHIRFAIYSIGAVAYVPMLVVLLHELFDRDDDEDVRTLGPPL